MTAEIYTRNPCPFCVRAKNLLKERGVSYTEIEINESVRETLIERVTTVTISEENPSGIPPKSAPQIFLDGEYIGGFDQLAAYYKKLDQAAG